MNVAFNGFYFNALIMLMCLLRLIKSHSMIFSTYFFYFLNQIKTDKILQVKIQIKKLFIFGNSTFGIGIWVKKCKKRITHVGHCYFNNIPTFTTRAMISLVR